jgi:hypothetical protein
MQFSYLAVFFSLFIIPLALLLLAPFNLALNIGKKGPLVEGSIKLAWLGLTLKKGEISPQSAGDLLASIWKEEAGKEERAVEDREYNGEEKARGEKEEREQEGEGDGREAKLEERSEIDNSEDNQKTGSVRSPRIQSLINAAPALANILLDLLKSILLKKISCRLCFGLDDPAQTAIISGYLWSLASVLGLIQSKIFIEPWFEGERLEGELVAEIEVRLWRAVFAMLRGLREREIRLLLREMLGWS